MTTIVEMDKAGRIVVPKKFRDALHLSAGTRFQIKQSGHQLVLEEDFPEVKLEMRDGLWVMTGGPPRDINTTELVQQGYEERHKRIMEGSGLE
jgi:AbrB family looped-hinge helix DNA binding protein